MVTVLSRTEFEIMSQEKLGKDICRSGENGLGVKTQLGRAESFPGKNDSIGLCVSGGTSGIVV